MSNISAGEGARDHPVHHPSRAGALLERPSASSFSVSPVVMTSSTTATLAPRSARVHGKRRARSAALLPRQVVCARRPRGARKDQLNFLGNELPRDLDRLVVAAAAQPGGRKGNRDHAVHAGVRQASPKGCQRDIRRQRELTPKLERMHQRVGGKVVGQGGDGGVVLRAARTGSARRPRRRGSRARSAGKARTAKAGQVGVAGRAHEPAAAPRQRKQLPPKRSRASKSASNFYPCGL